MSQPDNARRPPAAPPPPPLLAAFATTSPGLEPVLADELAALNAIAVKRGRAGVSFRTDRVGLERLTLALTTAHRVLWTLGEVDARDAEHLYRGVRALVRWQGLVPPEVTFAIDATCRDTPAFSDARFAGLKVKDAIVDAVRDALGDRPSVAVDDPDVLVRVSIARGHGVVSLDAAGRTSLHARGYRTDAGEAPLRESLAAALTRLSEWNGVTPLIDPMCGSGTILIEAALAWRRVVPGLVRERYGFMRWPGFRAERLAALRAELAARTLPKVDAQVLGFDVDPDVLAVARDNARRAGVAGDITLSRADARTVGGVPERGLLVTNPPWGARMGDASHTMSLLHALQAHWRTLGRYRAAVLVPDADAARALALGHARLIPLESGGREVVLALGDL